MIPATTKKRKYDYKNRSFNPDWEEYYAFTCQENKLLCLICLQILSQNKHGNVKRHHESNHKDFSRKFPHKSEKKKVV